ncbi:LamG-like jellyroll fold domain-containing protein [Ohtaekwangia koreensis]|nr:LamG-like jellyroll fold domain-containing protein [Ohtaekwangia koreensis]
MDGNLIDYSTANSYNVISPSTPGIHTLECRPMNSCDQYTQVYTKEITVGCPNISPAITGSQQYCQGSSVALGAQPSSGYSYQWRLNGNVINGATQSTYSASAAGQYTVTLTSGTCSYISTQHTLNEMPAPVANITGSDGFCPGQSIELSTPANEQYSYQWKKDGSILPNASTSALMVNTAGNYSVDVTLGQCTRTSSKSVVASTPPASITAIKGLNKNFEGELTLHEVEGANDATSFTWSVSEFIPVSGGQGQIIEPAFNDAGGNVPRRRVRIADLSAGTYKFKVTPVKDGCEGTPLEISYTSLSKALKPIGNYVEMFHPQLNLHSEGYLFLPKHSANYTGCSALGPVDLRIALDQGEVYNLGKNAFSASVNVTVAVFSDIPGQMQSWTFTLNVNQDAPEQVFMKTITVQPELVKFITIKVNSYAPPNAAAQNWIRLKASYEETQDIVDVSTLTVSPIAATQDPSNLRWEQSFAWTPSCTDIPDYIFQLVKKYGTNSVNTNDPDFWKDALQVQTESASSSVTLSMGEGSGTYYWRVIPLGNKPGGISNPENWGTASSVSTLEYTHPEENKNWIYSRTFTEGNKVTEQVTYANGLQQVSQQQTRIQDENRIVASQTIPDFIGRNAVSTLPIPVANRTSLGYVDGLLKNITGSIYSAADFDGKTPEAAMDLGGYYSGTYNEDKNEGVASAEGYPFTQTIFTPDGTGRVREQGGVGLTHSIKGGKTVRTFYTKATEAELVSLFGSEAPDFKSVQKITTYDANGTASVSFQTKDGKVIATALVVTGSTGSLSQLTNPAPAVKDYFEVVRGNQRVDDITVANRTPLFLTTDGTVTVDYEINPGQVMELCGSSSSDQVGNYPLEGNVNDVSGRNNHGTAVGLTAALDAFNKNGAYSFNGTTSYISVADGPDLDFGGRDFTVSFWVNRSQNTANWDNSGGVNKWNSASSPSTNEWGLHLSSTASNNIPGFYIESGRTTYQAVATSSIPLNTWYHLVGVRNGNQLKIYVNGVLEGSSVLPSNVSVNNIGSALYIGKVGTSYTAGIFDDVQLYSRALGDDEVKQLLQRGTICKTCDYTVSIRLFKEGDAASTDVITPYSITGGNCSALTPYNPGSVPVTLTGGVKYVLEKRLTLQNKKTTTQTYIDSHLQDVETYYRTQSNDRLTTINGFIAAKNYTGLYSYLASVGTPDKANGQYIVPLMPAGNGGCAEYIFVPILEACPVEQMPGEADCSNQDFEKYFADYYSDNTSVPVLRSDNTLAYVYFRNQNITSGDQKVYFEPGKLNEMIQNLIAEYSTILPCSTIWKIWKKEVAAYEAKMSFTPEADGLDGQDAIDYNADKDYFSSVVSENDMLGSFLSALEAEMQRNMTEVEQESDFCNSGKYIKKDQLYGSFGGIITQPELARAYRLAFYNENNAEQRMALKFYASNQAPYSKEQIESASVFPTVNDFNNLSDCDQYKFYQNTKPGGLGSGVSSDESQIQRNIAKVKEKCGQACEGRIEEFRQAIINSLFVQNPATVIEHYNVYKDDLYRKDDLYPDPAKVRLYVGILDVTRNTSGYTVSQCELDAMAQALVDNCKNNYCNTPLTPIQALYPGKTLNAIKYGTEEEILKITQAMTYDFDVQVNTGNGACNTGWDLVSGTNNSGWIQAKTLMHSANFQTVRNLTDSRGNRYLLFELNSFPVTFNDGVTFSNTDSFTDYVIVKFDNNGNLLWKKHIESSLESSSGQSARMAAMASADSEIMELDIELSEQTGEIIFSTYAKSSAMPAAAAATIRIDGSTVLSLSTSEWGYIGKLDANGEVSWIKKQIGAYMFDSPFLVEGSYIYTLEPTEHLSPKTFRTMRITKRFLSDGEYDPSFTSDVLEIGGTSYYGAYNFIKAGNTFYISNLNQVDTGNGITFKVNDISSTHLIPQGEFGLSFIKMNQAGVFQSIDFLHSTQSFSSELIVSNGDPIVALSYSGQGMQLYLTGVVKQIAYGEFYILAKNQNGFSIINTQPSFPTNSLLAKGSHVWVKSVYQNGFKLLDYNVNSNTFTTEFVDNIIGYSVLKDVETRSGDKEFLFLTSSSGITIGGQSFDSPSASKYIYARYSDCSYPGMCFRFTESMIKPVVIPQEMEDYTYNPQVQSCEEVSANVLTNTINQQVEQIISRRVQSFRDQYYHTCGDPSLINDKLTIAYKEGLYHFTLYYYDRAGNLVRTVPPEGVVLSAVASEAQVTAAKVNPPAHKLVTEYQYNTLGQLIREHSPDANFESGDENASSYRQPKYTPTRSLTWAHSNAVTLTGSSVTKNATAATGWNAGAISQESILKDGYVEWQFTSSARFRVMGLSGYNEDVTLSSIEYGLYSHIDGNIYIFEKGGQVGSAIGGKYSATDKFRIERVGSKIYYKKNGATIGESSVPSSGPLHVDCSISLAYGSIENIVFSSVVSEDNSEKELADDIANQALNESRYYATYIYNDKGQLRFSRNAQQKKEGTFSYTKYDELGRVIEVGESTVYDEAVLMANRNTIGRTQYPTEGLRFVTSTYYTEPYVNTGSTDTALPTGYEQIVNNLRNRISYTYLDTDAQDNTVTDRTCTIYNYDVHGNIEWLVQMIPGMPAVGIRYKHDLISGRVTEVSYNPGKRDEFYHRYEYDASNRLSTVKTSKEGELWETEARYKYYLHGPLKRAEIGEDYVQGVDYTYTVHGWLKGLNHQLVDKTSDPGQDAVGGSVVGRDAFGMALGYYAGDYKGTYSQFEAANTSNLQAYQGKNLYNGNIATWSTGILYPAASGISSPVTANAYTYDVLNRITGSIMHTYSNGYTPIASYGSTYTYYANGNLKATTAYGVASTVMMDQTTYNYIAGTNRLSHVDDAITSSPEKNDIEDQDAGNYTYDAIGNLTKDAQQLTAIGWNPYGKVERVDKVDQAGALTGYTTSFIYDAASNRVAKKRKNAAGLSVTNFYVRDASGNVMGVYEKTEQVNLEPEILLNELYIYGSDRLGLYGRTINIDATVGETPLESGETRISQNTTKNQYESISYLVNAGAELTLAPGFNYTAGTSTDDFTVRVGVAGTETTPENDIYTRSLNSRRYELKDHLGNIRTTLTDTKLSTLTSNLPGDYRAEVTGTYNYYPFGMDMTSRSWTANSKYRYGFNGKEKDDSGEFGNTTYDYGFRIYNPSIGRFLSVDPLTENFAYWGPYHFAGNKPIVSIDLDGLETYVVHSKYLSSAVEAKLQTWEGEMSTLDNPYYAGVRLYNEIRRLENKPLQKTTGHFQSKEQLAEAKILYGYDGKLIETVKEDGPLTVLGYRDNNGKVESYDITEKVRVAALDKRILNRTNKLKEMALLKEMVMTSHINNPMATKQQFYSVGGGTVSILIGVFTLGASTAVEGSIIVAMSKDVGGVLGMINGFDDVGSDVDGESFLLQITDGQVKLYVAAGKALIDAYGLKNGLKEITDINTIQRKIMEVIGAIEDTKSLHDDASTVKEELKKIYEKNKADKEKSNGSE